MAAFVSHSGVVKSKVYWIASSGCGPEQYYFVSKRDDTSVRYRIGHWVYKSKSDYGTMGGTVLCDGEKVGKWSAEVKYSVIEYLVQHQDKLDEGRLDDP